MWYSNSFWFIPRISSLIDPQDKHSYVLSLNEIISKRLIDFFISPLLVSEFSFKWASLCLVRQVCIYEFLWLLQAAEWALNKKWMLAAKFVVLYLVDELIIRLSLGLWLVNSLQYCPLIGWAYWLLLLCLSSRVMGRSIVDVGTPGFRVSHLKGRTEFLSQEGRAISLACLFTLELFHCFLSVYIVKWKSLRISGLI